mmetsp:Transcript_56815/g.139455  ORF Transcript_56815/g.139455 Transcript_56815/m.139455 type:complete len:308 (-) Transcript_56815:1366-2289(-)
MRCFLPVISATLSVPPSASMISSRGLPGSGSSLACLSMSAWKGAFAQCFWMNHTRMPEAVDGTSSSRMSFSTNPDTDSPVFCSPMTQHLLCSSASFAISTTFLTLAAMTICIQKRWCAPHRTDLVTGLAISTSARWSILCVLISATRRCQKSAAASYMASISASSSSFTISNEAPLKERMRERYCPLAFMCIATSSIAPHSPFLISDTKLNESLKDVPGPHRPRRAKHCMCSGSEAPVADTYTMRALGSFSCSSNTKSAAWVVPAMLNLVAFPPFSLSFSCFMRFARWHSSSATTPSNSRPPHHCTI